LLGERLGVDVFVDNDVNVAVFGEHRLGAGRGASDFIGCWIGTGIGAGLVLGGRIFHGKHLTAGELGHTILNPGNAPGTRSVEHTCSRTAISNRLVYLIKAGRKSVIPELTEGKLDKVKSKVLAEAYQRGDELTVEVVHDSAERLGMALANCVTLLSLERVVLGGGLVEALGDSYVKQARKIIRREAFPAKLREIDVVASELEDDAGVVGAALLAMHHAGV
jgi:glucokinase